MGTDSDNRRSFFTRTNAQRGTTPTIISGSDLGFRVDRQRSDRVFGTFLVRINGEWVVAEPATGLKPLSGK
jgi:hypothetical protein